MKKADETQRRLRSRGIAMLTLCVLAALNGFAWPGLSVASSLSTKLNELQQPFKDLTVEMHEGTNMAAAPSPDGKWVIFSLQGALWRVSIEGGTATKLTPWGVEATAPVWSPDGQRVAFQSYADGNYHIWTIKPDGTDAMAVTSGPFDDREPAWSADGTRLLFSSDRGGDGQYKIWSIDLLTQEQTQLTTGAGAESHPALSPDGTRLAFVNQQKIHIVRLGTAEQPQAVGQGTAPAWTPDGQSLVYQQANGTGLVVAGSPVANGEDIFPFPVRWLPDGRFLYTADGKMKIRGKNGDMVEIPFSASLTVRRPEFANKKNHGLRQFNQQAVRGINGPALSPDGKSVAFVALNDVWVMRIGQKPVRLTKDVDRDGDPQWTPDGKAIYFSTEKHNAGNLAVDRIEIASRKRTRLAGQPGLSMISPSMSPDGHRIAYLTGTGTLEIYDLTSNTSQVIIKEVSANPSRPNWSPDGKKILLVDNERINNRFREGYNKLRIIDVATRQANFYSVGQAPDQISDRGEGAAVWSPDGKKVAFIMNSVLHVMPFSADGRPTGAAVPITKEAADLPSWSGDSRTVLYVATGQLKTIGADGSNTRNVPLELSWTQAAPHGTTVIHAGALWNGASDVLQHDIDIIIHGNRIAAIQPHSEATRRKADRFVDASNLTVMPGLWDSHVHPLTSYEGGQFGPVWASMFAYGITSAQSVGGHLYQSLEIREALNAGNLVGPRLFVSPPLWEGNRLYYSFARSLRNPEVAAIETEKASALGVDFMKAYVRAPIPVMATIAQAAHKLGIPSGSHFLSPGIQAGLMETTHLQATERMGYGWSKSGNYWGNGTSYQDAAALYATGDFNLVETHLDYAMATATLKPNLLDGERFSLLMPAPIIAAVKKLRPPTEAQLNAVKVKAANAQKIVNNGVLLSLGTDAPLVAPGVALHLNLRAMSAHTSNQKALQMVTINAAKTSFVDQDLGSVEVGKIADLIAIRGNPLDDISNVANVEYVMKNGLTYSIPQILSNFRTPQEIAARHKAVSFFERRCNAEADGCELLDDHAHAQ